MNILKRNGELEELDISKIKKVIKFACEGLGVKGYDLESSCKLQFVEGMKTKDIQKILIRTANEKLLSDQMDIEEDWDKVASRLLYYDLYKDAAITRNYTQFGYGDFYDLISFGVQNGYYSNIILDKFSKEEIIELGNYINPELDDNFNFDGLNILSKRYLIKTHNNEVLELPQERFMVTAMWLAQNENDKMTVAKKFYDLISNFKISLATPILSNSGKPISQLSSCFVSAVDDTLWSIYDTNTLFANVSKWGGALGIYLGKIRSINSSIRNYKNVSGGVIPWIKLYNDTANAVDQLGMRRGSVTITLDIWHYDLFDFINIRTNNGDDRRKAHDVFNCISIPNLFMRRLKERGTWTLFDPHEVRNVMGYSLEDYYDDEYLGVHNFTEKYLECENSDKLERKIEVSCIDIMKKILTSVVETGSPFVFYRDNANAMNPMKHDGQIYSSNLCQEIIQNTSPSYLISNEADEDGVKTTKVKLGDVATCNLSSITLARVDRDELESIISAQVRLLDNTIDINDLPVVDSEYTNKKYRAIGIGVSDYHHLLVKNGIKWESEEHLEFADKLFEDINYYALKASMELAKEKGMCDKFKGSEYDTGLYFDRRGYNSERWNKLREDIHEYGLRNSYLLAVAPTGSSSNIVGASAGIDPIYKKIFTEEKNGMRNVKIAPELNKYYWGYKEAHHIDQEYSIRACGTRQRHIDQSQSFNIYINYETHRSSDILNYYIKAWEEGLKTIYYIRTLSLETDECTSCSS